MKKLFLSFVLMSTTLAHASDSNFSNEKESEGHSVKHAYSESADQNLEVQKILDEISEKLILNQSKLAEVNPVQFAGAELYDLNLLVDLRKAAAKDPKTVEGRYHEILIAPVENLKKFIQETSCEEKELAEKFINEIDREIESKTITIDWIRVTALRYLAHISDIQEDSLQVFQNAADASILNALNILEARESFHAFERFLKAEEKKVTFIKGIQIGKLNWSYFNTVRKYILGRGIFDLPYPVFSEPGREKFGVSFLTAANWMNTSPISIVKNRVSAHGTEASPLEFALHDDAHSDMDGKEKALINSILGLLDQHLEQGGSVENAEAIVQIATDHFKAFQVSMLMLQKMFMDAYYHSDLDRYNSIMNGFFWPTHEYSVISNEDLGAQDFSAALESICKKATDAFSKPGAWENQEDPLMTSPTTGDSQLSDDQIIKGYFEQELLQKIPSELYFYLNCQDAQSEEEKKQRLINALVGKPVVERIGKRFIKVKFAFKNGFTKEFSSPTLYHKWRNIEDANGLLGITGNSVQKSDLEAVNEFEAQRQTAQKTISQITTHLKEQISLFKDEALKMINEPCKDLKGMSIAEFYSQSYLKMMTDISQLTISDNSHDLDFLK